MELDWLMNTKVVLHLRHDDGFGWRIQGKTLVDRRLHTVLKRALGDLQPAPDAAFGRVVAQESRRHRTVAQIAGTLVVDKALWPLHAITQRALDFAAEHRLAPHLARHPRPIHERRPVANVLQMAAVKLRKGVASLVRAEFDNAAFHAFGRTSKVR